jgi:hypothetical protein
VASIDGFLDHFDAGPAQRPAIRISLRSLQPRRRKSFEPVNVLLWLLVALLHVGLFLVLDFAMRPSASVDHAIDTPLQVTIVRVADPAMPRAIATPDRRRSPNSQPTIPQADHALQAVTIQPRAEIQTPPTPMSTEMRPALDLYDMQGGIRLPAPPVPKPSDPFSRRAAADMLPGRDRAFAPGIRLAAVKSPKRVVETIGAMLFGGGHFDPCPEYEQRLLNTDNEAERDEQLDRYERACSGR